MIIFIIWIVHLIFSIIQRSRTATITILICIITLKSGRFLSFVELIVTSFSLLEAMFVTLLSYLELPFWHWIDRGKSQHFTGICNRELLSWVKVHTVYSQKVQPQSLCDMHKFLFNLTSFRYITSITTYTTTFLIPPLWDKAYPSASGVFNLMTWFGTEKDMKWLMNFMHLAKSTSRMVKPSWISVWTNSMVGNPFGWYIIFRSGVSKRNIILYDFALSICSTMEEMNESCTPLS